MTPARGPRLVALITGGARRVGRAISLELASRGCDLIVTYRLSDVDAATLADEARALGAHVSLEPLDLDDLDEVDRFGGTMAASSTPIDILVHNASIYAPTPLREMDVDDAMRMYRVNALAPLTLTKRLADKLRSSKMEGGGSMIGMVDIHAMGLPRSGFAPYAMSKAAMAELVRSMARELAPSVRVNGVAPGVIAWPESGYEADAAAQTEYLKRVPLGRAGTPRDAARTVAWLALDATYLTGQIVRLDGGRSLL